MAKIELDDGGWVKAELTRVFERCGLATAEANTGLACVRTPLGGWRAFPKAVDRLQTRVTEYSGVAMFGAHPSGADVRITNFVSSWFPFMNDWWRKMLRQQKGRVLGTLAELERALEFISQHLGEELTALKIADTPANRCALLNLYVARGTRNLVDAHQKGFPPEALRWLQAGVAIEHILYFFSLDGGWDRGKKRPVARLDEALEMGGVPLSTLAALYPGVWAAGF